MKLAFYFFSVGLVLIALSPYHCAYATQESDAVYNGFQQFLGTIYQYECEELCGGLSNNTQYVCSANENKYVVRLLKEPLPVRQGEVSTHLLAASYNIAPNIHYYDDREYSFVIMDFIDGQTLLFDQANGHDVLNLVANNVRSIAQIGANVLMSRHKIDLRALMIRYYKKIHACGDPTLNRLLEEALNKFEVVYHAMETESRPLVFGHNDLHPRNIFCLQDDMIIIDWETGAINYELYDLANYSVYACLDAADEYYLLTQYLQCFPSHAELQYFKDVKLLVKVFNAFGFLICLEHIPDSVSMESVKEFNHYARIFAQDTNANAPEFLYALALSLLQEFFEEYKNFENKTFDR